MNVRFDYDKTLELFKSFYALTKIPLALFDNNYQQLLRYPYESPPLCALMKSHPEGRELCRNSDICGFQKGQENKALYVYNCYAGLTEVSLPLFDGEKTLGYLIFGQVVNSTTANLLRDNSSFFQSKFGIDQKDLQAIIKRHPHRTNEEITAAAKILEACMLYIVYKELAVPKNDNIFETAKRYIEEHLGNDISIEEICEATQTGRTKLYAVFQDETKMGIAKYILHLRLEKAKQLLKTTQLPITTIANSVGFNDYNYFSRTYKKYFGKSPKKFRL